MLKNRKKVPLTMDIAHGYQPTCRAVRFAPANNGLSNPTTNLLDGAKRTALQVGWLQALSRKQN